MDKQNKTSTLFRETCQNSNFSPFTFKSGAFLPRKSTFLKLRKNIPEKFLSRKPGYSAILDIPRLFLANFSGAVATLCLFTVNYLMKRPVLT